MQNVNALPTQTLELKDIHVPEQISNFPIAYGWWLLTAFIIALITVSVLKIRKHKKRNSVKKQALKLLANSQKHSIEDTIALLKWAAMHYFSRVDLAQLFGNSLQHYLLSKLPTKHQDNFSVLSEQAFINQYKTSVDNSEDEITSKKFTQAAKLWLTYALPPKEIQEPKTTTSKNSLKGTNS